MTSDDRPMVHIRLSRPLLKRVDHLAVDMELDRARTIEHLLARVLPPAPAPSEGE